MDFYQPCAVCSSIHDIKCSISDPNLISETHTMHKISNKLSFVDRPSST